LKVPITPLETPEMNRSRRQAMKVPLSLVDDPEALAGTVSVKPDELWDAAAARVGFLGQAFAKRGKRGAIRVRLPRG
jgi:hypothetical protein